LNSELFEAGPAPLPKVPWHPIVLPGWLARIVRWATRPLYAGNEVDAITISHTTIFLMPAPIPWDLARHELEHVIEAIEFEPASWPRWLGGAWVGTVRYWRAYLRDYRLNGYENCAYEVRARIAAGQESADDVRAQILDHRTR
jgi:hypothetical protein